MSLLMISRIAEELRKEEERKRKKKEAEKKGRGISARGKRR